MASQGPNSPAFFLLFLNLVMYVIVTIIAGWAMSYGIDETPDAVNGLSMPARIFPIYYPIGNLATGFFLIFSLVSGLVGISTSISCLHNVIQGTASSLLSAAASSLIAWSLTLLATGLACKEISIGWRTENLRVLETFTIILSGTQLLCTGAIHAGVVTTSKPTYATGRV